MYENNILQSFIIGDSLGAKMPIGSSVSHSRNPLHEDLPHPLILSDDAAQKAASLSLRIIVIIAVVIAGNGDFRWTVDEPLCLMVARWL